MIMPFERLNVDVSCLGNHELDHGLKTAKELLSKTSCPWLMTNLVNVDDEQPILGCKAYHIADWNGIKFGFLGFAEEPWLDTFPPEIDVSKMKYIDYNESLQKYSKILLREGCEFVVAINHVRLPED